MTDKWPNEEGFISEGEIISLFKATATVLKGTLVKLTGDLEVQRPHQTVTQSEWR